MNICPLQTGPGPMGTAAASSTPERARGVQVVCALRPVAKNAPPSWKSRCLTQAARIDRVGGTPTRAPANLDPWRNQLLATREPERPGPPGPARTFVKCPAGLTIFIRVGLLIVFLLLKKSLHSLVNMYIFDIGLRARFSAK